LDIKYSTEVDELEGIVEHSGCVEDFAQEVGGSMITEVDGESEFVGVELIEAIGNKLLGSDSDHGSRYIRYLHSGAPLRDYEAPEYFTGAFPTLFPRGFGGHLEERKRNVSFDKWLKFLLLHHSRRFARHPWFLYVASNVSFKRASSREAMFLVKRKYWRKLQGDLKELTRADLENAAKQMQCREEVSDKRVWSLIRSVTAMGGKIPLSNEQREIMRRNAFGLIIWNGPPTFWLTINPNDLGNPLICKFAGVDIPLNVPLSVRKRIRRAAAVGNPVAAAQFYQAMINTFIKTLLRPVNASGDGGNGILGITDSYFGTVEASGRGALHFHCLVWSQGNIGIEDIYHQLKTDVQYQERVLSFLDQVTIESIDMANAAEPNFLEKSINFEAETTQFMGELRVDSNMVAGKVNMHRCTFSCRKYQTGEQACRFGAP
jgi:hypothetical protein